MTREYNFKSSLTSAATSCTLSPTLSLCFPGGFFRQILETSKTFGRNPRMGVGLSQGVHLHRTAQDAKTRTHA